MMKINISYKKFYPIILASLLSLLSPVYGQLNERPNDPLGLSIREPYVQIIHSEDASLPGSSMYLQEVDPWLAYKMGGSYFQREWKKQQGVFAEMIPGNMLAATNSCAMCHNQPFRSPGAGGNSAEPLGIGRNTPHLFGAGLIETIGIQIRNQIMSLYDRNKNGFIDVPKESKGKRAIIRANFNQEVDLGALEDIDGDGIPDLNEVLLIKFVDSRGRARPFDEKGNHTNLHNDKIAGYDIAVGIFSSSESDHQFPTLRLFTAGVLQSILGFRVVDPTISNDHGMDRDAHAFDGWAETSNAGAPQLYSPLPPEGGKSIFLSQGDLDIFEWFLLNHPKPALNKQNEKTRRGYKLMESLKCTSCHIPDWEILPEDKRRGYPGDRRFFDLEVTYDTITDRLIGQLHPLSSYIQSEDGLIYHLPDRKGYVVKNIFTDFKYYDLGPQFYEYTYRDGRIDTTRLFRTSPLWGLGSSAPYGHDGLSPTIDEVIRRHGGAANTSARYYESISQEDQEAIIAFLQSLTLYQPDVLPTDINGDKRIDSMYIIDDIMLGQERFQPELLFNILPQYRGWIQNEAGDEYFSYEILNIDEAFGRNLKALKDEDRDGIPDILKIPEETIIDNKQKAFVRKRRNKDD